jgi:CDP-diacylglycerol--glycerol-3-phosphate 3-phosphatidyltransferase/cardiolipin synthase
MDVRWSGKLATAGQFLLLLVAVLFPAGIRLALWLAILFSVVAAVDYGRLFILELRRRAEAKSSAQ